MPSTERVVKEAPTLKPGNAKIQGTHFKELAHVCHHWDAIVEFGLTLEDILKPEYWSLQSGKLLQHDEIRARAEDGSWVAYLIVVECGRGYAKMSVDRVVELDKFDPNQVEANKADGYEIVWRGIHHKFSVRRIVDKVIIEEGFQTKSAGQQWLNANIKRLA